MKKTYTITVDDGGEKNQMNRTNDGFGTMELFGILEFIQLEIIQQLSGYIKPDIIKREVVEDEDTGI